VTECITDGQTVDVFQSYNLDYYRNLRLLTVCMSNLHGHILQLYTRNRHSKYSVKCRDALWNITYILPRCLL